MVSKVLARIWLFLWPPIDNDPIEPEVAPVSETPQPTLFADASPALAQAPQLTRVPPHQRYRVVASDERWRVYSSFRQPPERTAAPRRQAS